VGNEVQWAVQDGTSAGGSLAAWTAGAGELRKARRRFVDQIGHGDGL
jgi:hypothetical protein